MGKEKLATWDKLTLMVDWQDFTHYGGNLTSQMQLERSMGLFLRGLAMALVAFFFILVVLGGNWGRLNLFSPSTAVELMPWLGIAVGMYSLFLGRDRNRFSFNSEPKRLPDVLSAAQSTKGSEYLVEIDDLLDIRMLQLFDHLYHHRGDTFMEELVRYLLKPEVCGQLWERLGVDVRTQTERIVTLVNSQPLKFDDNYTWLFPALVEQAMNIEAERVDHRALFFALFMDHYTQLMLDLNVQAAELQALRVWVRNQQRKVNYYKKWELMAVLKPKGVVNRSYTSRYAATLEEYGEDLTRKAAMGDFTITIGREQVMVDVFKVLQKDQNAACILIGDPGVGKTQFLKHMAVRMVVEDVPSVLQDKRLVLFNFNKAFTENQTLEQFKITLENLITEVAKARNVVMVLDDIDQLFNVRADLQAEIINLLVSGVGKYNLKMIATASSDGYHRFIKPIRPLSALFQAVTIAEPEPLISLQILIDEAAAREARSGVKVQVDALRQIVSLAPQYAYERVMPDKAIDLLEEGILEAKDRGLRFLTADVVSRVVSRKVGVSVGEITKSESEKLVKLEENMHKRVVGQNVAISAIASALRRSRAGLSSGKRPISSFLFFGPTGVGKTEVAKTLAQTYYGDEKMMIRIDMSEYHEEQNLQRLIGYTEGAKFINGFLTQAVRARPFSLVLLDEIEKANPKVLDLFLQVLDEGHLTDGAGQKVDFTNTIIIATSNAGSREIAELIGEGMKYDAVYERVLPNLRQVFRVEFLNRFDKIIMFKPLLPGEVAEIAVRELAKLGDNLLGKGIAMVYGRQLLEDLVRLGYDPVYGARQVKRVIQEKVEDAVAEKIVRGELLSGKTIKFNSVQNYEVT